MSDNARYIDFDAARAERKREPVIIKLFDREWELPLALPANIPIEIMRLMADGGAESDIANAKIAGMMSQVVPKEILDHWCKLGLGADDYGDLLILIIRAYMGQSGKGAKGEQGEAKAPEAGASA